MSRSIREEAFRNYAPNTPSNPLPQSTPAPSRGPLTPAIYFKLVIFLHPTPTLTLSWGRPSVPVSVRVNSNVPCSIQGSVLLLQESWMGKGMGNEQMVGKPMRVQTIALITSQIVSALSSAGNPSSKERFSRPLNSQPINFQQLDAPASTAKENKQEASAQEDELLDIHPPGLRTGKVREAARQHFSSTSRPPRPAGRV